MIKGLNHSYTFNLSFKKEEERKIDNNQPLLTRIRISNSGIIICLLELPEIIFIVVSTKEAVQTTKQLGMTASINFNAILSMVCNFDIPNGMVI